MNDLITEAKNNQLYYRPSPFWSWNDDLNIEELKSQIRQMSNAGLGGFFMHARVGLKTLYQGDKWFECIKACIEESKKCNIQAWGYDENGYPSGIADGKVCAANTDYRSTWIEWQEVNNQQDLKNKDIIAYYKFDNNEYKRCKKPDFAFKTAILVKKNETRAADPMNEEAVKLFLNLTHEEYYKRLKNEFGNGIAGFFTDEPQLKQFQLPWSVDLDKKFQAKYGYNLLDKISCLFDDTIETKFKVRNDYWSLVNSLYCTNFGKQINDWCRAHNVKFTGHIMGEDTILEQMGSTGGCMQFYQYMDIPGMDWLGRRIGSPIAPKQVSSVACQLGKRRVLSETFALSGWNVSFSDLKWIAEWQIANGINFLCPHLESYSLRGIRKRDYPASLFIQQPWWKQYSEFTDYISSLGSLLAVSNEECDLVVIHPLHSAYVLYNGHSDCDNVKQLDEYFKSISESLQNLHIGYHFGDEEIIKGYGSINNKKFVIGGKQYTKVLLPNLLNVTESTFEKLKQFSDNGGKIYYTGDLPKYIDGNRDNRFESLSTNIINDLSNCKNVLDNDIFNLSVTENNQESEEILSTVHVYGDTVIYFIVNTNLSKTHDLECKFNNISDVSNLLLPDYELKPINYVKCDNAIKAQISLNGGESVVLISKESKMQNNNVIKYKKINLPDNMKIVKKELNKFTMDLCDFSYDGKKWEENVPIIFLQKRLLDNKTDQNIFLKYKFKTDFEKLPQKLYFVSENLPQFELKVNGKEISDIKQDYFLDKCFKKIDISDKLINGINECVLYGRFWQRKELYDYLYREKDLSSSYYNIDFEFESVTYDTEIESAYLVGDFRVDSGSKYQSGCNNAIFTNGPFILRDEINDLKTGDITKQGYPFYSGSMTVEFNISVKLESNTKYILNIKKPCCPAAILYVNNKNVSTLNWEPINNDITQYLSDGNNVIRIELLSGLRNTLGPHHYKYGESKFVGVSTFGDTSGWCEDYGNIKGNIWNDGYAFVCFGINNENIS